MLSPAQELQIKVLLTKISDQISFNVSQGKSISSEIESLKEVSSLYSAIEYKVPYDLVLAQFNYLINKRG